VSSLLFQRDRVTGFDLVSLRLTGDPFVILSACETGRGQQKGDELLGLVRSLFLAGARGILTVAWPVLDAAAAKLVPLFLEEELRGEDVKSSEAISLAVRAFVERHPEWDHPFFWSAFRVYGFE
jgi:CHAT domain-containing protein